MDSSGEADAGGKLLRLEARALSKPWGREQLARGFEAFEDGSRIGEIWHARPDGHDDALLVKHLFTSERLSIQVHPGEADAAALGLPRGKDEAWLILDAQPGARLGLGLKQRMDPERLRAAALNGSIEDLLEWRPVASGDFFFSPAGTIHAIGGGLALIEIQQNLDVTYRLYDYGRPRELHLDEGLAVARPQPWSPEPARLLEPGRTLLSAGGTFVVEQWHVTEPLTADATAVSLLLMAVSGTGRIGDAAIVPGEVWSLADGRRTVQAAEPLELLVAYAGERPEAGVRSSAS